MTTSAESTTRSAGRAGGLLAAGMLLVAQPVGAQQMTPGQWLDRMATAVGTVNYEGTVIRRQRGDSEALKVARSVADGVISERLVSQEGNGLEIIRIGAEVHCILPDRKTVLVEGWNNQSTLFTALPSSSIDDSSQYDLSVVREGRIAGRPAVLIAVRPHDEYRYARRLWLDSDSAFPLQSELTNMNGELIEEVKFADITIAGEIDRAALSPSVDLQGFTWYREPARYEVVDTDTQWACEDLPPGFRLVSARSEQKAGDAADEGEVTTHIVYSDGIASVSVFIARGDGGQRDGWAPVGIANSFTVEQGEYEITAFGEVPGITVQRIASSMRQQ